MRGSSALLSIIISSIIASGHRKVSSSVTAIIIVYSQDPSKKWVLYKPQTRVLHVPLVYVGANDQLST